MQVLATRKAQCVARPSGACRPHIYHCGMHVLWQTLLRAVEEAKEVAAHRKDHEHPTTAFDMLDRSTWENAEDIGVLDLPSEPSDEDVRLVRMQPLSWLYQIAAHPQHTYEVCRPPVLYFHLLLDVLPACAARMREVRGSLQVTSTQCMRSLPADQVSTLPVPAGGYQVWRCSGPCLLGHDVAQAHPPLTSL
jgi:hypothetical protein